jgi:hypothetical protein
MWNWLEKQDENQEPRKIVDSACELIGKMGELLANNRTVFHDESLLPADKQSMKNAVKIAWLATKDRHSRNIIEAAWMFLPQFQPRIGEESFDISVADLSPESIKKMEAHLAMIERSKREGEADLAEWRQFVEKYNH